MSISYEQLEARIADWARQEEVVRAVLVIGSHAWAQDQVDEWSDLDLVIFAAQPSLYWGDLAWLQEIGDCWVSAAKPPLNSMPGWLPVVAIFSDRLRVDFVFQGIPEKCTISSPLGEILVASAFTYVFSPRTRVLFDRGGCAGILTVPGGEYRPVLPSQPAFAEHIKLFWIQAVHIAQLIQRGELWRADQILHCELRRNLLVVIEWHALVMQGPAVNLWPRGRFLEKWADPRVISEQNRESKAGGRKYQLEELFTICELYRSLAQEIAHSLGFTLPLREIAVIDEWLSQMASF